MDEKQIAMQGVGVLISLLAGAVTKKLSKSQSSIAHEWAAPAVAAAAGIGYAAVTGGTLSLETVDQGVMSGSGAVLVHSLYYGLKTWTKSKKEIRR